MSDLLDDLLQWVRCHVLRLHEWHTWPDQFEFPPGTKWCKKCGCIK